MSFLEGVLPSPRERLHQALTNDLQLRRNDSKAAIRFSPTKGYAYVGGADLLLREGRFYAGRELPPQYHHLRGPLGRCFDNAMRAAEADPSLTYCEGVYHVGFGGAKAHAWCVAPDGEMLELTFPADMEALRGAKSELNLPFLPPEHWGYYGVTFNVAFVRRHNDTYELPLLDRSPGEYVYLRTKFGDAVTEECYSEVHDFPALKITYDPNRTELP